MLEEPEPAVVELDVEVCVPEEPEPAVADPVVFEVAFDEPELLTPVAEVEPELPDAFVELLEVVEVWVPDDPLPVLAYVVVEFCEPDDPELFVEPVWLEVAPELP